MLGSPRRRRNQLGRSDPSVDSDSDGEELMDVGPGRIEGLIAPLRVSSSTDELDVALGSARLYGPGPCFGRHLLKLAPSHEKTADRRTLKDNCLYFMCIPIWMRTGAAFAVGLTFLLVAFFTNRIGQQITQAGIGNYYSLDETAGGFGFWRESQSDSNLGNFSACVSVRAQQRQSLRCRFCAAPLGKWLAAAPVVPTAARRRVPRSPPLHHRQRGRGAVGDGHSHSAHCPANGSGSRAVLLCCHLELHRLGACHEGSRFSMSVVADPAMRAKCR